MKKRGTAVLLFFFCLALGFLLVNQVRMTDGQTLYVSARTIEDYNTNIKGAQKELEDVKKLLAETRNRLETLQTSMENEEDVREAAEQRLADDLAQFRMLSGATALKGPGVTILIDDGTRDLLQWEDPNELLVHDADILMVLNELFAAGAEAVSVNGERVMGTSAISCSGHTIRINGTTYARPFTIQAIGDGARMVSALMGPGCPGTILQDYLIFKVTVEDDLLIPAYTGAYRETYQKTITQ
ncbi:MAG: DUF881 domain-containing protein [Clostridiales bacterium]|nr:DUF881 domain-containing protein [Clostridiales bacterium]